MQTGKIVYIIDQTVYGMFYGVCGGECGYSPQTHVHCLRTVMKSSKICASSVMMNYFNEILCS